MSSMHQVEIGLDYGPRSWLRLTYAAKHWEKGLLCQFNIHSTRRHTVEVVGKVRLSRGFHIDPHRVSTWVHRAMCYNVEEFYLDVCLNTATHLSRENSTCTPLMGLKLQGNIRPRFLPSAKFPMLKILDLNLTKLEIRVGDVSFPIFLFGFLLLKELHIYGDLNFFIHISMSTLKKLKLHLMESCVNSL